MSDSESKTSTETGVQSVVHTPGPWEAYHVVSAGWSVRMASPREGYDRPDPICSMAWWQFDKPGIIDNDISGANAKLIAAAPELLEAIQAALRIEPLWMPPDDENNPEYDAEFAALAMMRNQFKAVVARVV